MSPEKFPHRGLNSLLIYEMSNVIHLEIGSQAVSATPPIVEMLTFWSLVCASEKERTGFINLKSQNEASYERKQEWASRESQTHKMEDLKTSPQIPGISQGSVDILKP